MISNSQHTDPLCTDINTPEEDNTWDESKTQTEIENYWEAELAADLEFAET